MDLRVPERLRASANRRAVAGARGRPRVREFGQICLKRLQLPGSYFSFCFLRGAFPIPSLYLLLTKMTATVTKFLAECRKSSKARRSACKPVGRAHLGSNPRRQD